MCVAQEKQVLENQQGWGKGGVMAVGEEHTVWDGYEKKLNIDGL